MSKGTDWMDGIEETYGIVGDSPQLGIEIVCRLVISEPSDHEYVNEVIEKCREIGAAHITKQVTL